jgi:hypothetical protein
MPRSRPSWYSKRATASVESVSEIGAFAAIEHASLPLANQLIWGSN